MRLLSISLAAATALLVLSACSGSDSGTGDVGEDGQRTALENTWDKFSEDDRRGLCDQFSADPVGAVAIFEDNFDYDVVKQWLESKC